MNLIEAIKSGLPFRRPSRSDCYYHQAEWMDALKNIFNKNDILAEDWEIKEPNSCGSEDE